MLRVGPEQNTALLSAELDSVRNLLEAKQRELNMSMQKVEQLTSVLGDLRKTSTATNGAEEVNKLNRELNALHNLNNDQSQRLQAQRDLLRKKQEESQELDMKILELADRINKKRAAQTKGSQNQQKYTNVAAVEPLVNSTQNKIGSKIDGLPQKAQVLNNITSRTEIAPDDADRKKRGQRPISEILTRQDQKDSKSKSSSLAPGNSLFQYRNPSEEKPRPPPPSYTEALSRRSLPGQASRGKLGIKKPVSPGGDKNVFDEWRKRYANTPRPLKKRSSFSEAEGNNYYQQLYKTSDPLFRDPRNIPLEEEAEQSSQSSESENQIKQEAPKSSPSRGGKADQDAPPTPPQRAPDEKYSNSTRSPPQLKSAIKKPRGILKKQGAPRNSSRRVELDPLALLLDASLAGEIDVVRSVIAKVSNPSYANDEGITALHNAVCAGYFDVVKFLVHSGVDINAADSDGWTPLHCAASCNSLQMVKFLCENGAQIFAETYPDNDTAAEKCEELDEGYVNCTEYLYGTQEKLGVVNKASVYALFDYDAESSDELSFKEGDLLYVKRRGDSDEDKWWWSRHSDTGREGYVPRNYLGMWPRIKPPSKK
ncbi:Oidioi.mRNA.OKI2018_I69.chr1.g3019.t1.cds [Oikopleura dioica]|uniref:Oidioi.mRNA.OKI2018_I69.chr1.g3019.t1.cds n=1 Tax=Oikopleura dioica TaxID=34765 RepID=A0ABN7SX74_OIKDI|nr:Oidioi.mRNA.OKI2018_I69.chr1.g3019.t1.cds [Oikopleura dioica]